MFTKKTWLLAVPVAAIAIQGCGGGGGGLLSPTRTSQPANTPIPGVTATPVPGTRTPTPNPTVTPTPRPTMVPNPMAGDNIARYSAVTGSNVDATQWFATVRGKAFDTLDLNEVATRTTGNDRRLVITLRTFRTPEPGSGSPTPPLEVGKSYPFGPEPSGIPTTETVTGRLRQVPNSGPANANDDKVWQAIGGNLIVDRITGPANNPTGYFFRVVNARFSPDPQFANGATGSFTLNYNGDATDPR